MTTEPNLLKLMQEAIKKLKTKEGELGPVFLPRPLYEQAKAYGFNMSGYRIQEYINAK